MNVKTQHYQQRVENILLSLRKLDYLSRPQIQELHRLSSAANANRILRSMSKYLQSFRLDKETIYYLSKEGRDRVNCSKVRKKTMQANHFLLRNQLCLMMGYPPSWQNEVRVQVGDKSIVSDAFFKHNEIPCFVEIDNTQTMKTNALKIERYRMLQDNASEAFNLIWLTNLRSRKSALEKACEGLSHVVYTPEEVSF